MNGRIEARPDASYPESPHRHVHDSSLHAVEFDLVGIPAQDVTQNHCGLQGIMRKRCNAQLAGAGSSRLLVTWLMGVPARANG
jgi:hypothetical protein